MQRRQFLTSLAAFSLAVSPASAQNPNAQAATVKLWPALGQQQLRDFSFDGFVDKDGKALLQTDIQGKYPIIYGGYLECTGVCPGAAESLVNAITHLKKNNPDIAAQIIPLVVMIKNEGNSIATQKARALKWQTEGLQGDKTGIRVLVADNKTVEAFKKAFRKEIKAQHEGTLVRSPWAYLFGPDGTILHDIKNGKIVTFPKGMITTQDGEAPVITALKDRITVPEAAPANKAAPAPQ